MSNVPRMAETLRAIRTHGCARRVMAGRECAWFAGTTPLSGQIVWDLTNAGWLTRDAKGGTVTIDAWPSFARSRADE